MKAAMVLVAMMALALVGAEKAGENMAKPTNKPESWRLEQIEGGKGTMSVDGEAIVCDVTAADTTEWHVQMTMTGVEFKEGKTYAVSFAAKAASGRAMQVSAMIDQDDWHTIGLQETADLTKDWKDFKYEFKAEGTAAGKNRISFMVGQEKGKVWMKGVEVKEK